MAVYFGGSPRDKDLVNDPYRSSPAKSETKEEKKESEPKKETKSSSQGSGSNRSRDDNVIYISEYDYEVQKRMVQSDPTISFGARDFRNPNVKVGSYTDGKSDKIYGYFSDSGYVRSGNYGDDSIPGQTKNASGFMILTEEMAEQAKAVARALGYNIDDKIKEINLRDWQNAINIGADYGLAGQLALGEVSWNDVQKYLPNPRAVILSGTQSNDDFWKSFDEGLARAGYDPIYAAIERERAKHNFFNFVDSNPNLTPEDYSKYYNYGGYNSQLISQEDFISMLINEIKNTDINNYQKFAREQVQSNTPNYSAPNTGVQPIAPIGQEPLFDVSKPRTKAVTSEKNLINDGSNINNYRHNSGAYIRGGMADAINRYLGSDIWKQKYMR